MNRSRRLRKVVAGVVLVGLPAAGWVAGRQVESSRQAVADARPPERAVLTEAVVRRALTKRLVFRGVAVPSSSVEVSVAAPANTALAVVTATPLPVGASVAEGAVVLEISGRPVVALAGAFPAYRDIGIGDSGRDVVQLEEAMRRIGRNPGRRDGVFDVQLASVVDRLWSDRGYTPARRTEPTSGIPVIVNGDGNEVPARQARDFAYVPRSEVTFIPSFPAFVQRLGAGVGAQPEGAPLSLGSGGIRVRGEVPAADVGFVAPGAPVEVAFGDGRTVAGEIAEVEPVRIADDGRRFAPVSVAVDGVAADAIGQDLRLTVQVGTTSGEVLVVPVVALRSRSDGGSDLEVIDEQGGSRVVDVEPGLSAEGFVEVMPIGGVLSEGDRVRVG